MNEKTRSRLRNRSNVTLLAFLAVGGYFLWTEHQAHVIEALPWVLILGCLLMHLFMHGGHGHRDDNADQGSKQE
jgi:uncharacterized membrane protein YccC